MIVLSGWNMPVTSVEIARGLWDHAIRRLGSAAVGCWFKALGREGGWQGFW